MPPEGSAAITSLPLSVSRLLEMERKVAKLWMKKGDLQRAIASYRTILKHDPNSAETHKQHTDLMVESEGLVAAFDYYGLSQKTNSPIQITGTDLLCCCAVRNELLRLPYFLTYYRAQGVTQFFFVDNGSTDGTDSYLQTQPDVHFWTTDFSFNQANFGSVWFDLLLRKYALNRWCLLPDADELFYYPDCEYTSVVQLTQSLDRQEKLAYPAIVVDMYSDRSIVETLYRPGQDLFEICPYFDRKYYHQSQPNAMPYKTQTRYTGGMKERVFGKEGDYYLNKVILLKYTADCVLVGGQHWSSYAAENIDKGRGAVLHFKYISSFLPLVEQEVGREEHYNRACQYRQYAQKLAKVPNLALYDEELSLKLESSQQLVDLGIMQRS